MKVEHLEHAERGLEISKARALNLEHPEVPNSTKVVRIFVVGRNRAIGNPMDDEDFAKKSPGRADVFAVTDENGKLKPKSWLGGKLVDHDTAHHEHIGTVVVLNGAEREQIEWQCDVPFKVVKITKLDGHGSVFPSVNGPLYPFMMSEKDLKAQTGDRDRPIRSGPTTPGEWSQLYKADFELFIQGEWKPFDPDFYCDHN
jgi:hypothetical protein